MKILEICVDLDGGGIDRYLLNYCSRIRDIQFDFAIVKQEKKGILEAEIEALGCKIYQVPRQRAGLKANYDAIKKILTENHYDAVHVHLGYRGALALLCAKNCGIKTRIVHAHIAAEKENFKQKVLRKVFTVITRGLATHLAACGVYAAKWVWGERVYAKGEVKIHNNAIDTQRFRFREEVREKKRSELGLESGTLAVGHVGRLSAQKNQTRLLNIFAEILHKQSYAKLFLVGRGEDENKLLQQVKEMGLESQVVFLGVRSDVDELLNAFDVFVFPSLYEGLPFTLIETQCNGLPAICADTVTSLVKVSEYVRFSPLEQADAQWAEFAIRAAKEKHGENAWRQVMEAGYDIDTEAEHLRAYYKTCIEEMLV